MRWYFDVRRVITEPLKLKIPKLFTIPVCTAGSNEVHPDASTEWLNYVLHPSLF